MVLQRSCVIYLEIMLHWETKNALVVRIFVLLPILLLTGSNNLLHLALFCQECSKNTHLQIPEILRKTGHYGANQGETKL